MMYVCCAFCKFFPCPLVSPYCQNFQPSIKLWPTILNRNQRWNGFRVKLFSHILPPRGQFRRPNVECGSKSAIIGENLWKYSWSHQELPYHSPLIPLYSLSRETRFSLRGGTIKPPPHVPHIQEKIIKKKGKKRDKFRRWAPEFPAIFVTIK